MDEDKEACVRDTRGLARPQQVSRPNTYQGTDQASVPPGHAPHDPTHAKQPHAETSVGRRTLEQERAKQVKAQAKASGHDEGGGRGGAEEEGRMETGLMCNCTGCRDKQ
jgi:hypothetical protein